MMQELKTLENINTVTDFKKALPRLYMLKELPPELTRAVIDKDLPLDTLKELIKLNDKELYSKVIQVIKRKNNYEKNILNISKFAIKRSKMMKDKFLELKKIEDQNIVLSTIWDFGKRDNYAGSPDYYGNAPTQVVEQCILRLTNEGDTVLDPMAGSGTTIDVCKVFNRHCIAYDLHPPRKDIILNDSRSIPLKNNSVNLAFFHPPYFDMVKYSNSKNDLSNQSLNEFYGSMEAVMTELLRVIKKEGYMVILVGDLVKEGKYVPISRKISNIAESMGFEDCGQAIKITSNSVSQIRRGRTIYAELSKTRNLKVNHDVVMFWKKN